MHIVTLRLTRYILDGQDRIPGRCHRVGRPGGIAGVLLPRPGSESAGVLFDIPSLQGIHATYFD